MPVRYSAPLILQRFIRQMGTELGTIYHALWVEVVLLYTDWEEYVVLFGTSEARVRLLNASAHAFFAPVGDMMWEHTLLHITRVTDAPKKGKQGRLTVRSLPKLVDPSLHAKLELALRTVSDRTAFCRDWRDRYIAHTDLQLALDSNAKPLREGSRQKVEEALDAIAEVMNIVGEHYGEPRTHFVLNRPQGAERLLQLLQYGLLVEKRRQAQMERGEEPDGGYGYHHN
jgi:hypothetical protein